MKIEINKQEKQTTATREATDEQKDSSLMTGKLLYWKARTIIARAEEVVKRRADFHCSINQELDAARSVDWMTHAIIRGEWKQGLAEMTVDLLQEDPLILNIAHIYRGVLVGASSCLATIVHPCVEAIYTYHSTDDESGSYWRAAFVLKRGVEDFQDCVFNTLSIIPEDERPMIARGTSKEFHHTLSKI